MKRFFRRLFHRDEHLMSCAEVGALVHEYLDGVLDPQRSARLKAHIEDCRRCGLEVETYNRIKRSLASRPHTVEAESLARLRAFGERIASGQEPIEP
jgi:anti-sigma factor RsiW